MEYGILHMMIEKCARAITVESNQNYNLLLKSPASSSSYILSYIHPKGKKNI